MQRPGGRTERVRKQVVTATVELLAEGGVTAVSVDTVAQRSSVARTTIYRRWGSTELILLEALREELAPRARKMVDTGSFRGDLLALLRDVTAFSSTEQGRGILEAVFIQRGSPVIAEETQKYWTQRFAAAGELVRRAVERGELDAGVHEQRILEMAVGPVYMRLFITHQPIDQAYLKGIVEFVLAGSGAREPAEPLTKAAVKKPPAKKGPAKRTVTKKTVAKKAVARK
jgi:AcrR family transcriptional regulator